MDYIDRWTGLLAICFLCLIAMIVCIPLAPWLILPAAIMAGALIVPTVRWYQKLLFGG